VVIPNYNHGHLIEDALAAIGRQTMAPAEVVVVDDGSTDDSVARLQSLAASMPWLRVLRHGENRGVNAACNSGLAEIAGDFVLFSAADDLLGTETVERAFAAAAAFPTTGIVFSDHAEMSPDGASVRISPLDIPDERRYFPPGDFVALMQRDFFYFHVSNVWFSVPLLRALGGFAPDLRWHGDLFAAYAAAFEAGAVYVPGAVSYFRIVPNSYSSGARSAAQLDVLRAWLKATRQPGWGGGGAPRSSPLRSGPNTACAVPVLLSDMSYLTPRLAGRLAWLAAWSAIAPFVNTGLRRRLRALRSRHRRSRLSNG
jgi:glycosyltransferase involved in cell wall biosynthesis